MNAPGQPGVSSIHEKALAGRVLSMIARVVSAEQTSFTGWMVAGGGASFGIIVVNIASVSQFIEPARIGLAVLLFLLVVGLHTVQRWLSAITTGSAAASGEAHQLITELAARGQPLNVQELVHEIEKGILPPTKWLVRRQSAKILQGDLAAGGRLQLLLVQIQGYLVLLQMFLLLTAAAVLAFALRH
jgi:hypothetical protein